jgi:hypothetical protein
MDPVEKAETAIAILPFLFIISSRFSPAGECV